MTISGGTSFSLIRKKTKTQETKRSTRNDKDDQMRTQTDWIDTERKSKSSITKGEQERKNNFLTSRNKLLSVSVCVCERERERERESVCVLCKCRAFCAEGLWHQNFFNFSFSSGFFVLTLLSF